MSSQRKQVISFGKCYAIFVKQSVFAFREKKNAESVLRMCNFIELNLEINYKEVTFN